MTGMAGTCRLCWATAAAVGAALMLGPAVQAQVMEIGDAGQVRTYAGPTIFSAAGATPIETYAARRAKPRRSIGHAAAATPGDALQSAAGAAALSPDLVAAVAWQESRYRPGVVSRTGAVGEMQLMPGTARALGVDPYDSGQNYRGGAAYLGGLMRRYDGDLVRSLAAYDAGPGAVDRYGGVPPYRETRAYVASVLERLSLGVAAPTQRSAR